MTRSSFGLILGVVAFGLGGYGLGSGWIRFGPPGQVRAPSEPTSTASPAASPRATLTEPLRIAPADLDVIRTKGPGLLAQAATPAPKAPPRRPPFRGRNSHPLPAQCPRSSRFTNRSRPAKTPPVQARRLTISRETSGHRCCCSAKFTVVVSPAQSVSKVSAGGVPGAAKAGQAGAFDFDLTNQAVYGKTMVQLFDSGGAAVDLTDSVTVNVPRPGVPLAPTLVQYANGTDADPAPVAAGLDKPTVATVFGKYLKVSGQDAPSADPGDLIFLYYVHEGAALAYKGVVAATDARTTIDGATRNWDSVLSLPELALGAQARLFAVAKTKDSQAFSNGLDYERQPIAFVKGQVPTLDAILVPAGDSGKPTKIEARKEPDGPQFYVNSSKLIFAGGSGKKRCSRTGVRGRRRHTDRHQRRAGRRRSMANHRVPGNHRGNAAHGPGEHGARGSGETVFFTHILSTEYEGPEDRQRERVEPWRRLGDGGGDGTVHWQYSRWSLCDRLQFRAPAERRDGSF